MTATGFLAPCGGIGTGTGVPNATSPLDGAQSPFCQDAGSVALSGEYVGNSTIRGTVCRGLRSSCRNLKTLGGAVVGNGSKGLVAIIAWNLSGNVISGNRVGPAASGSGTCTFSMTAARKFRRINGSYSATYGCPGQTGTSPSGASVISQTRQARPFTRRVAGNLANTSLARI